MDAAAAFALATSCLPSNACNTMASILGTSAAARALVSPMVGLDGPPLGLEPVGDRRVCAAAAMSLAACLTSAATRCTASTCGPSVLLMLSRTAGPRALHSPSTAFASLPTCFAMSPMHRSWCAALFSPTDMNSSSRLSSALSIPMLAALAAVSFTGAGRCEPRRYLRQMCDRVTKFWKNARNNARVLARVLVV